MALEQQDTKIFSSAFTRANARLTDAERVGRVPKIQMLGNGHELNKGNERYPAGQDTAIHEAAMTGAPHGCRPSCQSPVRRPATSRREPHGIEVAQDPSKLASPSSWRNRSRAKPYLLSTALPLVSRRC